MTAVGWIQIILYCAIVVALAKPLGWYMTRVFNGEATFLSPVLRPVERGLYWISGVDERREHHWLTYTVAMLLFHVGGFLIIYGLMRLQAVLPFNPAGQGAVAEDLSFNTAISFITNTNWQNYGGESTLSYLVQMLGLTHQNFLSAATGIVLAVALLSFFSMLDITMGLHTIVLAHVVFNLAFVCAVVRARLKSFDWSITEASADLGASAFTTFRRVTIPVILPAVIAGALLAFTLSVDEFIIAFFTAGAGRASTTLPMQIYSMIRFGITPEINALATIVMAVSVIALAISQRLNRGMVGQ